MMKFIQEVRIPLRARAWTLVVLVASAGTGAALAQEDFNIDDAFSSDLMDEFALLEAESAVVVSATRSEQKLDEAPAIVTVIQGDEIARWGYTSLAGVLRHVAGFHVIDDHIVPNVGVRGISGGLRSESGLIKVLIDGSPVASRLTGGNWLGAELIPLTAIERIEVIRGPASALYGADAFLGVINIITRSGEDLEGGRFAASLGVMGANPSGGLDATGGFRRDDLEVLVAARLDRQDVSGLQMPGTSPAQVIPDYNRGADTATGADRTAGTGLVKLKYQLSEKSSLTATGYLSGLDAGGEFADWSQLANGIDSEGRANENRISMVQGFADVSYTVAASDAVDLSLDAMYFRGGPTDRDHLEVGSDTYWVRREYLYQGVELAASAAWKASGNVSLLGGADLVWDHEDLPSILHVLKRSVGDLEAGDVREATSTIREAPVDFVNTGVWLQGLVTGFEGKLGLTGGLRHDLHNVYGNQFSGRAAAVYSPTEVVHVKLLYGNAFKAPSPLLLYGVPVRSGDIIGNPSLAPQRVHTFETQLSWTPQLPVTVRTDLAYSYLQNKAEFTLQGVNRVARNVAEVGIVTWETEAVWRHREWLQSYLNLSVLYGVRNSGAEGYQARLVGSDISGYPGLLAHAGGMMRVPGWPVRLTLELSYVGARRASDSNALEAGEVYVLPAFVLVGGSVSLLDLPTGGDGSELMLTIQNALDDRGADPGFAGVDYPLAPRTLLLQWRQSL